MTVLEVCRQSSSLPLVGPRRVEKTLPARPPADPRSPVLLVGFVAGIVLGAVGGITGRLVRGIVAGLVVGAILIGISAMAHLAVGVAGELRSFDTGSIKGEIAAAIYGMVIGAIGGGVGAASGRLLGPKE